MTSFSISWGLLCVAGFPTHKPPSAHSIHIPVHANPRCSPMQYNHQWVQKYYTVQWAEFKEEMFKARRVRLSVCRESEKVERACGDVNLSLRKMLRAFPEEFERIRAMDPLLLHAPPCDQFGPVWTRSMAHLYALHILISTAQDGLLKFDAKKKNILRCKNLAQWLMIKLTVDIPVAYDLISQLVVKGFLHPVNPSTLAGVKDVSATIAWPMDMNFWVCGMDSTHMLNAPRLFCPNEVASASADDVIFAFTQALMVIRVKYFSRETYPGCLHVHRLRDSLDFYRYLDAAVGLQVLDLSLLSSTQIVALFLNVYNGLAMHIHVNNLYDTSPTGRLKAFTEPAYLVGGMAFSLYDIKHGILRQNRPFPGELFTFTPEDPRAKITHRERVDLMHFGLTLFTHSSPSWKIFTHGNVLALLRRSARRYLRNCVSVQPPQLDSLEPAIITLPCLFAWYRSDFGRSQDDVMTWLRNQSKGSVNNELTMTVAMPFKLVCEPWDHSIVPFTEPSSSPSKADKPPCVPHKGFNTETGYEPCPFLNTVLETRGWSVDRVTLRPFRDYFHNSKDTVVFLGHTPSDDCMLVALCPEDSLPGPRSYRVLVSTPEFSRHIVISAASPKEALLVAKNIPGMGCCDRKLLTQISDPDVAQAVYDLEETMAINTMKFGVIYYKEGQTEDEIFANSEESPAFAQFLDLIGERINLKGWDKYSGGLDVEGDATGKQTLWATHGEYSIIFHVTTMMPLKRKDPQQIDRKRHIANDTAVLVFHEGDTPFNPSWISTHFVQAYIVVHYRKAADGTPFYRIGLCLNESLPYFPPYLQSEPYPISDRTSLMILQKLVQAQLICFRSKVFSEMMTRTTKIKLKELSARFISQ